MDTIKKHSPLTIVAYILTLVFATTLFLTGCSPQVEAVDKSPQETAEVVEEETTEPSPPPVNEYIKQFGETVVYADGVELKVDMVGAFEPTVSAMGAVAGEQPTIFAITIVNNSEIPFEPVSFPTASSGGVEAAMIADAGNPTYGDVGLYPQTTVLPGQTISWNAAYSIADPTNVTFEVSPSSYNYENGIFTNIPF